MTEQPRIVFTGSGRVDPKPKQDLQQAREEGRLEETLTLFDQGTAPDPPPEPTDDGLEEEPAS